MLAKVLEILDEYEKPYNEKEVTALLLEWERAKAPLINILAKHPNWDNEQKCITLTYQESRNNNSRYLKLKELETYILSQTDIDDEYLKVLREFQIWELNQFLDSNIISCINNIGIPLPFKPGQKTSRAVNKIFSNIGADKLPEYNKLFAQFADSVNPLQIDRKAVLSVNPVDYLLMSNGTGWKSCHIITDGCYQAGCLSYMCDNTTMIFYIVDEAEEELPTARKITRNVFCYSNGKLMQSRLYPDNDEIIKQNYRQIVQDILAKCLELPNIWRLEKDFETILSNVETHTDSLNYQDYEFAHFKPNLSFLKDYDLSDEKLVIGSPVYCLECGEKIFETGRISCCTGGYSCENCGCSVHEDDVIWFNDYSYCQSCVSYCDRCGNYTRDEVTCVAGRYDYVCDSCLDDHYKYVDCCDIYVPKEDAYLDSDGEYICKDCLVEKYQLCSSCNEYHKKDEIQIFKDIKYCQECYDNLEIEEGVSTEDVD
jgi:hypothetical protein